MPLLQLWHVLFHEAPIASENVPAQHSLHPVALGRSIQAPLGHAVQPDAFPLEKLPGGHLLQFPAPLPENSPAGQAIQAVYPSSE